MNHKASCDDIGDQFKRFSYPGPTKYRLSIRRAMEIVLEVSRRQATNAMFSFLARTAPSWRTRVADLIEGRNLGTLEQVMRRKRMDRL